MGHGPRRSRTPPRPPRPPRPEPGERRAEPTAEPRLPPPPPPAARSSSVPPLFHEVAALIKDPGTFAQVMVNMDSINAENVSRTLFTLISNLPGLSLEEQVRV